MLTCDYYCSTIMTGCNDKMKTQQYADMASCLATCAGFFKTGALSDTMGDTLGCRIYHAGVASKDAMSALTHCGHAGPTGGDKDVSDAAGGPCGEGCESFCAIQAKVCTGANQVYADIPTCMAACKMAPADVADYSIADTATNDFGCRMYHLTAAASAPALHCAHITGAKGTPCNP